MSLFRCNVCAGTYRDPAADGLTYFHRCPPIHNPAYQPDPTKPNLNLVETIERGDPRDENFLPGLVFHDGKLISRAPDPHDSAIVVETPVVDPVKHQGPGRTQIGP